MKYQLAQLNIARFKLPQAHPDNADFINNLDRVNAIAEAQPGFIWRFTGAGNDALDVQAFDDPNIASNMSIWKDVDALFQFVHQNQEHTNIMRRRHEWFGKIEFYVVLWWIDAGHKPTLEEAKARLETLQCDGPSERAFSFKSHFPAPGVNQ